MRLSEHPDDPRRLGGGRSGQPPPIVDTSFDIAVGETVVVGTSRLRGDKALILLLTAVPQAAASAPAGGTPKETSPTTKPK